MFYKLFIRASYDDKLCVVIISLCCYFYLIYNNIYMICKIVYICRYMYLFFVKYQSSKKKRYLLTKIRVFLLGQFFKLKPRGQAGKAKPKLPYDFRSTLCTI